MVVRRPVEIGVSDGVAVRRLFEIGLLGGERVVCRLLEIECDLRSGYARVIATTRRFDARLSFLLIDEALSEVFLGVLRVVLGAE